MKYIPGFTFTIGIQTNKHKGGSVLQQFRKTESLKGDQEFALGNNYKLFNISKTDNKFIYTFINQTDKNAKTIIEFNNMEEADKRISTLIGAS